MRTGRRGMRVTREGLQRLAAYGWPGNIRELANALERATILATRRELGAEAFDLPTRPAAEAAGGEDEEVLEPSVALPLELGRVPTLAAVQREHILRVLALTRGRIYGAQGAAALLGLKPSTLQSRMKKLGIARAEGFV